MSYLTTEEVAKILNRSKSTIERWRREGRSPPYFKNGGTILYSEEKLIEWIEHHSASKDIKGHHF